MKTKVTTPTEAGSSAQVEPLWTVRDVATFASCSTSAVYKWVEKGPRHTDENGNISYGTKLPCRRIGALVRFRPSEVQAWLDGRAGADRLAEVHQLRAARE